MGRRLGDHLEIKNTLGNKKRKVDELDRISDLPDDILASILSHLSWKEAAQMSILSSRWRDVWMTRHSFLILHDNPGIWDIDPFEFKDWHPLDHQIQFIDWVDGVLEKHKVHTLNEFRVKSDWLCNSTLSERATFRWIYFAIRKRVQRLDLALSSSRCLGEFCRKKRREFGRKRRLRNDVDPPSSHQGHSFPRLSFLLSEVEGFSCFVTTLKVLRLRSINVDGELLAYLLSTSPVLEHLSVSFSQSLDNLQVQAPSVVNLKYFELHHCLPIDTIHFDNAPNLECIRVVGFRVTISIKNAPHLINVSLGKTYHVISHNLDSYPVISRNLVHLSNHVSQLEVLTLEIEIDDSELGYGALSFNFPTMIHLKQLTLTMWTVYYGSDNFVWDLNNLLSAMPSLYRLHLKIEKESSKPETSRIRHECLKVVQWDGYQGSDNDYHLAKFLADTCKVLEKVTMKWSEPCYRYGYKKACCPEIDKLVTGLLESKGAEVMML